MYIYIYISVLLLSLFKFVHLLSLPKIALFFIALILPFLFSPSPLFRAFDQQMADKIVDYMQDHGTKFVRFSQPTKIEKISDGKLKVTWMNLDAKTEHSVSCGRDISDRSRDQFAC